MYKSKLQELCHQQSWNLQGYATVKEGPDHMPRFTGTVSVNGFSFRTQNLCRSSKEAQNEAARLAFDELYAPQAPLLEVPRVTPPPPPPPSRKDMTLYENQLPILAQKANLPLHMYSPEHEGPPHAHRFRCNVSLDGRTSETVESYNTLKETEHAAASIAPMSLSSIHCGLYKSLLQEFTQKQGYGLYRFMIR